MFWNIFEKLKCSWKIAVLFQVRLPGLCLKKIYFSRLWFSSWHHFLFLKGVDVPYISSKNVTSSHSQSFWRLFTARHPRWCHVVTLIELAAKWNQRRSAERFPNAIFLTALSLQPHHTPLGKFISCANFSKAAAAESRMGTPEDWNRMWIAPVSFCAYKTKPLWLCMHEVHT